MRRCALLCGTDGCGVNNTGANNAMVETVMGYPPSHPLHAQAAQILMDHQVAAAAGASGSASSKATVGLRSAFALACESPRALGIGL